MSRGKNADENVILTRPSRTTRTYEEKKISYSFVEHYFYIVSMFFSHIYPYTLRVTRAFFLDNDRYSEPHCTRFSFFTFYELFPRKTRAYSCFRRMKFPLIISKRASFYK